jgi:pimeloyl-ACP methyl ester carboxylesterase
MKLQQLSLHGHTVGFRTAGSGPAIVLVHGMAGSSRTWRFVAPRLAEQYRVIVPDLPGHGESHKSRGDYSLGAYACGLRDLLAVLEVERATVVGQSLGGGVAMQFAYMFPSRVDRLVLVGSGGLGREVSPVLRALSAPGAEFVLPIVTTSWARTVIPRVARLGRRVGLRPSPATEEVWRAYSSLCEPRARTAFLHTLRSVVDVAGQRVNAADRLYLSAAIPTMVVWGDRDRIIPVTHAYAAHRSMPGSRLEIFEGAGHFVHCDAPDRFVEALTDFMGSTVPGRVSDADLRGLVDLAR